MRLQDRHRSEDFRQLRELPLDRALRRLTRDADLPPDVLHAAALGAIEEARAEAIPDQRDVLETLRAAVLAIDPSTAERVFNPDVGPFDPDEDWWYGRREDVLARLDALRDELKKPGPEELKNPFAERQLIVENLAVVYQRYSGYHADDDPHDYLADLFTFIWLVCAHDDIDVPGSVDGLRRLIPKRLRVPDGR